MRSIFLFPLLLWASIVSAKGIDQLAFEEKAVGTYAHYDIVAYEETFLGLGRMKTYIITYGISEIYHDSDVLIQADTFCHAEHLTNFPIRSYVSDDFTRAIRPPAVALEVLPKDDSYIIYRPPTPTPIGVAMEANDPLPVDPDDPRIVDSDGDGNPGVTVTIEGPFPINKAELYIARLEIFSYYLASDAQGGFAGHVVDKSHQLVVGSTNSLLRGQRNPAQHPDPALSPIYLIPVDEGLGCDELMQQREALFPPAPQIW